jgi:hypothetical protein
VLTRLLLRLELLPASTTIKLMRLGLSMQALHDVYVQGWKDRG